MINTPKREQLSARDTWNLSDIFKNASAWEDVYAQCERRIAQFESWQGKLGEKSDLKTVLDLFFDLRRSCEALSVYASMKRDEDNALPASLALADRAEALSVKMETASAFIRPELLSLPESYLQALITDPAFSDYDVFLRDICRWRPHTRSAAEERVMAMAGEITSAPNTIYNLLTNADMRFPEIEGPDGKFRLTQSNYIPTLMSRDRALRKAAFEAYYETYKQFAATIPAAYAASVKADQFWAKTGNFATAREAGLFGSDVPLGVYDNLIEVAHTHIASLNRFFAINARLLGLDQMAKYDVYVTPVEGFSIDLPFEKAYALVVDCLKPLGTDYQALLEKALADRWIDPYENQGKHSGAYSWGTYDSHPYVLLNYHEDLDSLLTVAHEMGHSMHSYFSDHTQPYPKSEYALFVAEVASTVNEVLVLMELLDRYPAREAQAYLLYNLLSTYQTTLFRQTLFAEFERASHEMNERGEALTSESLNALYAQLNAQYYPGIAPSAEIAYEWMRIPHFFRAFYVYMYATGFSAATAIATAIREEGEPAAKRYRAFLSTGGSLPPLEALKIAGVDLSTPEPIECALKLFDTLVDRYENAIKS